MNSPAKDIAKYLGGQSGLGAYAGSADFGVFVGLEPNEPKNCVTIYDLGGPGDLDEDQDYKWVEFQVRVRCEAYSTGYDKHKIIRDLLVLPASVTCETSTFSGVVMTADAAGIGRTENNQHVLTATYRGLRAI